MWFGKHFHPGFFLVHFQGPGHSSYSLTFQTRTCTLCLGDTFETQLHSSGSCLPWISSCSDRLSASLASHLQGRAELESTKLSERKDNYNTLGHFYSPIFWVTDIDQASQQGRLKFDSLVGMKGRRRTRETEGTGRCVLSGSFPL